MSLLTIIVLVHTAATLYMTGLIWFVQLVHYPLFDRVNRERFDDFEREHQRRTSIVVIVPMFLELGTAIALLVATLDSWAWVGAGLLAVIWVSTYCLQVPAHQRLRGGYDATAHRKLVRSNWIRTIGWSLRSILLLGVLAAGSMPLKPLL